MGKATNHQVVQDADIEEAEGFFEAPSDSAVSGARLGVARRMVVEEHHGRGVVMQGALGDDPGMHLAAVDGAREEMFGRNDPMLGVQENGAENFVRQSRASGLEVGCGCIGVG